MILRNAFANLFAFAALAVSSSFASARADFENLWTRGHGDISVHYEGADELHLGYELGSNAVINGVAIGATTEVDANYLTAIVPNAPYSRFDGGVAGLPGTFGSNTFWYISQSNPGPVDVPFLGIGAEEIESGIFVNDALGMRLKSVVDSPAGSEFIVYRSTILGNDIFIDTQNLGVANQVNLIAGSHGHYFLGFSEPGTYLLEFEAYGDLVGGGTATGSAVYAFNVVPEPAAWVSMSMALVSIGIARRYRKRLAIG